MMTFLSGRQTLAPARRCPAFSQARLHRTVPILVFRLLLSEVKDARHKSMYGPSARTHS